MEPRLLLVHAITLLYWENMALGKSGDSSAHIKEIVEAMEMPAATLETDDNKEILYGLRHTVLHMCDLDKGEPLDKQALLQRIKINCMSDTHIYTAITDALGDEISPELTKKKILEYSKLIQNFIKQRDFQAYIRSCVQRALYTTEQIDVTNFATEMQSNLEKYTVESNAQGAKGMAGVLGEVDFSNVEEIAGLFKEAQDETSLEGMLQFGYQAVNRMLGSHAGIRRGDFMVVGALQHNYKTGFTLNLTKQVALYNKPYMLDPDKKPLILHISSENQLTDNILLTYSSLKENRTGEVADCTAVTPEEAAKYIYEETSINGYAFKMLRVNPSEFTYQKLFNLIMFYESEGYEIHLLTVDYLNMFSKVGCTQGPTGSDTRDLFRRVRNFTNPRKIAFITPHQISTEAKYLLRNGTDDFVKEIVNKGYYDSCKTIDQEVDIEILIHIVKVNGRSYLTLQRGKHRKSGPQTPEKDLYCVLPFFDAGGCRDDLKGEDLSLKKPGGRSVNDDRDDSWFDMAA
jgi:hypothetical protein